VIAVVINDWLGYEPTRQKRLVPLQARERTPGSVTVVEVGLGPLLENLARFDAGQPFFVVLVLNELEPAPESAPASARTRDPEGAKERWRSAAGRFPFVRQVVFRPNLDFDIGAYDHGLQILRREGFDGDVVFMNSALRGPHADGWLARYHTLFHERPDIGLVGVTLSAVKVNDGIPHLPHVQSFFLYSSMRVLNEVFPERLYKGALDSKQRAIAGGELAISQAVLRHGYAIRCAAFPDFVYKQGGKWEIPLVKGWRGNPELAKKYANTIV
jgi:hypothetical protein